MEISWNFSLSCQFKNQMDLTKCPCIDYVTHYTDENIIHMIRCFQAEICKQHDVISKSKNEKELKQTQIQKKYNILSQE
jgi:hypothetical protein